ncbi:DUF4235 domain-containing protein [Frankia sp. CNm7]|uniref:DUF4235 domain-containing protein n=1 Tax=Frankia nepalensis TaxID=1836974 RepID=A0A937UTJ0_9ACTN|nr:DUF4235 domain-containing protein [Frankia nepalensis]MBL7501102.1 DUF4235 domain-containing protein [Frankia nepalensis]MBL7512724.1 DUF4235 domain-containing protein [Frankia nepalensis]MBL7524114.1 DUF4235 domain-containing protein [Frankia nepalensis]MBL7631320.1 DUF4235 domain-containing protein [Frankia nepalensis]
MSRAAKLAYRPVSMVGGIAAGAAAGVVVNRLWTAVSGESEPPSALKSDSNWAKVVLAAALQGAVFAATKTAVDRASAVGFARVTGTWPGD